MGLPQWMVALRHDAVHSNLPSLTVLRNGVQIALAWLKVGKPGARTYVYRNNMSWKNVNVGAVGMMFRSILKLNL